MILDSEQYRGTIIDRCSCRKAGQLLLWRRINLNRGRKLRRKLNTLPCKPILWLAGFVLALPFEANSFRLIKKVAGGRTSHHCVAIVTIYRASSSATQIECSRSAAAALVAPLRLPGFTMSTARKRLHGLSITCSTSFQWKAPFFCLEPTYRAMC